MKYTHYVLLAATLSSLFLSCNQKQDKFVIAFSQCSQDDWRTAMNNEVLQEASFHPNLEVRIKSVRDDTEQQIRDIEGFISDKVSLIAIAPNEAVPLTAVVEKAMRAGIPVLLVDRKIASKSYTAFVGADNYLVGQEVGIYVAKRLNGKGKIMEIQGLTGSTPATERHEGFMSIIHLYPEIEVVELFDGEWFREIAKTHTRDFIKKNGKVDLIFAHNDQMALGAQNAYTEAGIERPHIVGIDALSGVNGGIQMVLDDVIDATFIYPTGGEQLVQTALRVLSGESYSRDNILYTAIVDKSNARVLKLQTDQIVAQQNSLARLNTALVENLSQYATQRLLLYGSLLLLLTILLLLVLLIGAYRKSSKTNQLLEKQNRAINSQKEELSEQCDQLTILSKNLQEATQAKLVFFTNVSHEFRTPLTLIAGPLDKLAEKENLSDKERQMVQLMQRNVRVLQRLIDQIIDFRKVENGKMELKITRTNLRDFMQEVIESFTNLALQKQIHLLFKAPTEELTLWCDAEKIEVIFYNLLSNAFKHTPKNGKIVVEITKTSLQNQDAVQIQVQDTGVGISKEHMEHIFERFYKANETTPGSGIGLALTKVLIELHNGTIWANSEIGKGTVLTVCLPLKPNQMEPNILTEAPHTTPQTKRESVGIERELPELDTPEKEGENPLVLIVEDNDDIRTYTKALLADNYNIIEAENGQKGLLKATQSVPDLIISDVMMEVMDGFELCKQLKENISTSHIPIILLTSCLLDEQRAVGFESGADAYIPKPFNENLLKIRIRKMIENRKRLKDSFQQHLTFGEAKESITQIDRTFMEKFRKIVEQNITKSDLNVDEIGKQIGLSRVQLYRKVKSLTNFAPNELVRIIRLKEAEKLLISSEKSISEIAYDAGFSSPSYFTKCFKEHFNKSPTEYLQKRKG